MEKTNREYYQEESPGRADYWKKMAAPRSRIAVFLDILKSHPASSLVDLGCGNGELLSEVESRHPGIKLCGIDSSAAQIESNRARNPSIDWKIFDLDRPLEFQDGSDARYDIVLASEIIEHVQHPDVFLRNASRLAKDGAGLLLLSTQSGKIGETERRVGHQRHFSKEEMTTLLSASGWTPRKVWNAGFPFHDLSKWYANLNPDATVRRFGGEAYGPFQNFVCLALRLAFRFNSSRRGAQLFAVARKS